jgi:uncharacterized protein YjbI with pentapeptide repeats
MSESDRTAASDGEAPVNPYSLLEAVNRSSDTAHTGWLIFIAIMGYLLVTVAGVTHKDLLLSRDITLPILQVKIELTRVFLYAPLLFVLFHAAMMSQLAILARKALAFDTAIRMLEVSDKPTHPLRLELSNFFFVQAVAGPERSRVMSLLLHAMSWLTLILLPILVLLYVQVTFLPYHDVTITWAHRIALMADVVMVSLAGVFLLRPEPTVGTALRKGLRHNPHGFGLTLVVLVLASLASFFVATIPGEPLDRIARPPVAGDSTAAGPFVKASADGALFGFIRRNLDVADVDFVAGSDVNRDAPVIVLRGRDLRQARLDRANLHQADLTGADLDGASLVGANLRKAMLQCANPDRAALGERREAGCATARNADLTGANLKDARMTSIDLSGATLAKAEMEAADLTGAMAQGANFTAAKLQGADLTGAQLTRADFTNAGLQGAALARASLSEVTLRNADLEAADLAQARLQGANLGGARLRAANLHGAVIWMTSPPDPELAQLADLSELIPKPIEDDAGKGRVVAGLDSAAPVLVASSSKAWADAPDQQAWQQLGTATATGLADNYKVRLTDHLVQLACKPRWADGSVATGVIRRALAPDFKGDLPAIHDRLKADACPAAKAVAAPLMRRLAIAVDTARGL